MKKTLLFCLLTVCLTSSILAQAYLESPKEIDDHAEKVMKYLSKEKFQEAFISLKGHWPLPENEIDELERSTIKQFNMVANRFGKILGQEFIKDEKVKDFVIQKTYALRFEKHLLRVYFIYYKNDKGWILNSFKWDDDIDALFE